MGRLTASSACPVGINLSQMDHDEKQAAYATADITYGTNNEFGFDYLRDNMVGLPANGSSAASNFAIVDEVDSILIDEARTPLIISGQAEDHTDLYLRMNAGPFPADRAQGRRRRRRLLVDNRPPGPSFTAGYEHAEKLLAATDFCPRAQPHEAANIPSCTTSMRRCGP